MAKPYELLESDGSNKFIYIQPASHGGINVFKTS